MFKSILYEAPREQSIIKIKNVGIKNIKCYKIEIQLIVISNIIFCFNLLYLIYVVVN